MSEGKQKMPWEEYKQKYAARIIEVSGMDPKIAEECAEGAKDLCYDNEEDPDPILDADAEMECWSNDEDGEDDELGLEEVDLEGPDSLEEED